MATATCDQSSDSGRSPHLGTTRHASNEKASHEREDKILRNLSIVNWITSYSYTLLRCGSQPRGGRMSVTGGFSAMPLKSRREGHR
jgi:hypothetical protein